MIESIDRLKHLYINVGRNRGGGGPIPKSSSRHLECLNYGYIFNNKKRGGGRSTWNLTAKRICFTLPAVADPVGTKEPISWNFAISLCFIYIKNVIPTSPGKNGHMLKIWTFPWKKSKISLKYRSACYKPSTS